MCVGFPSAPTPSEVYLTPSSPHASIFSVWLFGAGPGLYLVLAGFIFQVPMLLSAANAAVVSANNVMTTRADNKIDFLCIVFSCVRDWSGGTNSRNLTCN